jgi:DNA polymerase-3 subunit epsilon
MNDRDMNFTAVDFETSAWKRASACAVGAVAVRGGVIVDSFYSLLKPPKYPYWNYVDVHGITRAMVERAPTFPEVWPRLKNMLGAGPFVAHNAPFDWAVLKSTLGHYGLLAPEIERLCTLRLAQRKLPELSCHSLAAVAEYYDITLKHHHAASDARACAEVAIRLWANEPYEKPIT